MLEMKHGDQKKAFQEFKAWVDGQFAQWAQHLRIPEQEYKQAQYGLENLPFAGYFFHLDLDRDFEASRKR